MKYISRSKTLDYSARFTIGSGNMRNTGFWKLRRPRKPLYYVTLRNELGFLTLSMLREFVASREIEYPLLEIRPSLPSFGKMQPGEKVRISIPVRIDLNNEIECKWDKEKSKHWIARVNHPLAITVKDYLVRTHAPLMRLKQALCIVDKGPAERIGVDLEFRAKKGFPKEESAGIDLSDLSWRDKEHVITRDYDIVIPVNIDKDKYLEVHLHFE